MIAPGSEILGVPASEISEIINPSFNNCKISIINAYIFTLIKFMIRN